MKLQVKAGATSNILQIFIRDSSSLTGGGLTGLTNGSGSLTAYYHRENDTTATVISLQTMTVGTFTSAGFKEIDSANMPGWYQFCPPDAAITSGAKSCAFHLKGASNMAPLPIEMQLVSYDPDNATTLGLTNLDTTISSRLATSGYTAPDNTSITSIKTKTDYLPSTTAGASGGVFIAGTNAVTSVNITGNITGNLSGSVGSVTGLTVSNLDVTVSSRLPTLSYTAPDNTTISTINTKIGTPNVSVSADIQSIIRRIINFILLGK